jgi:DNA-binding LacI/PurR family transcriptional regulator
MSRVRPKRDAVKADLRGRIVSGLHRAGDKLPTRAEMLRSYGVSTITLQQALDALRRDGFVVSRGPLGTFVADHPPHLSHYGLVFPSDPSGGEGDVWLPLWRALRQEALKLCQSGMRKISLYYNITGHTDVEDHQQLLRDLHAQRLAGLIFVTLSKTLLGSPLLESAAPPRVFLFSELIIPAGRRIMGDLPQATAKALDYFVSRGRKRIAVLDVHGTDYIEQSLKPAMAARGLEIRPYWFHEIDYRNPAPARRLVHLLLRGAANDRPDGLFVVQQFLAEQATAGVADSGLRVPADLDLVAGCNFPWPSATSVPVRWLGVDIRRSLEAALDVLDRLRAGRRTPACTVMPSIFEEELMGTRAEAESPRGAAVVL